MLREVRASAEGLRGYCVLGSFLPFNFETAIDSSPTSPSPPDSASPPPPPPPAQAPDFRDMCTLCLQEFVFVQVRPWLRSKGTSSEPSSPPVEEAAAEEAPEVSEGEANAEQDEEQAANSSGDASMGNASNVSSGQLTTGSVDSLPAATIQSDEDEEDPLRPDQVDGNFDTDLFRNLVKQFGPRKGGAHSKA